MPTDERDTQEDEVEPATGAPGGSACGRWRQRTGRHIAVVVVGAAIVVATFAYFLPQIADYRDASGLSSVRS